VRAAVLGVATVMVHLPSHHVQTVDQMKDISQPELGRNHRSFAPSARGWLGLFLADEYLQQ
jgi:hypothetical protein